MLILIAIIISTIMIVNYLKKIIINQGEIKSELNRIQVKLDEMKM